MPIPQRVLIERIHVIPTNSPVTVEAARERFADAEIERTGSKLIAHGTIEQQEEIAAWLKFGGQKPLKPAENKPYKPLRERRFTLTQKNATLGDVIKTFTTFGVQIDYAPDRFAEAEISLDKKIDIDVTEVSAERLFRDLFEPLGIKVTIDGETVRLKPKPKSP